MLVPQKYDHIIRAQPQQAHQNTITSMLPVRCYDCNMVLANKQNAFIQFVWEAETVAKGLREAGREDEISKETPEAYVYTRHDCW